MKKIISGLLAMSMAIGVTANVSAKTKEELSGYSLLYENTFDGGKSDAVSFEGEGVDVTYTYAPLDANHDGNKGIYKNSGVINTPIIRFDFPGGATTGVYKVGFDFLVDGTGSYRNSVVAVNRLDAPDWKATDLVHITENFYSIKDAVDTNTWLYDWPASGEALEANKVNRMEMMLNLDENYINYYMDGIFVKTQTNLPEVLDNFVFYLQGDIKYFDNLKLEKFDALIMSASVNRKDDGVYVDFTDGIENKSVFAQGLSFKNLYTGEVINATAEVVSDFSVKLLPETELISGMEYKLILPEGLKGRTGGMIDENPLFNLASENAVFSIDLVDVRGKLHKISDENPTDVECIKIEFTEDVDAVAAISGLTIENKEDGKKLSYTSECEANTAKINLSDFMLGNSEYKLSLKAFNEIYDEITIKTQEGKSFMLSRTLVDESGEEIFEIPENSPFGVKLVFGNTSDEAKNYTASVSLYDGKKMVDIKLSAVELLPGAKVSEVFNMTSEGLLEVSVRGAVLDEDNTISNFGIIAFGGQVYYEPAEKLGEVLQVGDLGVKASFKTSRVAYIDVLADGKEISDITSENVSDIVVFRDYCLSDGEGISTFEFELLKTNDYDVYVTDIEKRSEKIDFTFVNNADYNDLAENIGEMDAKEIEKILDGSNDKYQKTLLGISDLDVYDLNTEELSKVIKNTISDEPITSDRDASWAIIDRALFVQKLNDETIKNICEEDEKITGLSDSEISEWYEKEYVGKALRENFTERLSGRGFESYKEYKNAILPAFILATVKEPNGSGNVEDILKEFEEEIDIDIKSDTKSKVWTKLSGKDFDSLSELEEAYNEAVKASESSGSGGSGGGGGGSKKPSSGVSGTVTLQPVLNNELQNVIPGEGEVASFSDIDSVVWAKEAIEDLATRGIINGIGNNQFNPNGYITREQFVKIAVGAFVPDAAMANPEFSDVQIGAWYEDFIRKAYAKGITNGMGDGKFGVGENITRQDMCVMIYNAAKAMGMTFETAENGEFEDDYLISDYAKEAVYMLKNAGAVNGVNEFEFEPKGNATRAQAAKIIYSLIK